MKMLKRTVISFMIVMLLSTSICMESALAAIYQGQLDQGYVEWEDKKIKM